MTTIPQAMFQEAPEPDWLHPVTPIRNKVEAPAPAPAAPTPQRAVRPAEKVALLTALIDGATVELAAAKAEALALADTVGVKSFNTPFGSLAVSRKSASPAVTDPDALLAWVMDAFPSEVEHITRVRPAFVTVLLGRVEWSKDLSEFVDTASGEAVPGMDWSAEGDPYIAWSAGDVQRATKAEARAWFHGRTDELLSAMAPQIEAS